MIQGKRKLIWKRRYAVYCIILAFPILCYAVLYIYARAASLNTSYVGPLPGPAEFIGSDDKSQSKIMETILWRVYQEDDYRPYVMQEDYQEVMSIFYQNQETLEILIDEILQGEKAIIFNASNDEAQGFRGLFKPGKSLVLLEDGLSFFYSAPSLYWSVIRNERLSKALNQINTDKRIEIAVSDNNGMMASLNGRYFRQSHRVFYTYSENNMVNFIRGYGIKLDDKWKLEIMTNKYGRNNYIWDLELPEETENEMFRIRAYQGIFRDQTEEYQRVLEIFQRNKKYLDDVVGKGLPLTYLFLGEDWKKHLVDVPDSGFLERYDDYYFLGQHGESADEDIYKQIRGDRELHWVLNTLGREGEIRSIYEKDGCTVVALAGIFFEEELKVELYYTKNKDIDMDEDIERMKIDPDWIMYISPGEYQFFEVKN